MINTNQRLLSGNNGLNYVEYIEINDLAQVRYSINIADYLSNPMTDKLKCKVRILGMLIRCQNEANSRLSKDGKPLLSNADLQKLFLRTTDKGGTKQAMIPLELLAFDPKTCCNPNYQNIYWEGINPECYEICVASGQVVDFTDKALEIMINYCPLTTTA